MLKNIPSAAVAVVVGVDHYGYGEAWELAGPAADALRYVDWLMLRGVDRSRIALFLSTDSWTHNPNVIQWTIANNWELKREAKRDNIVRFIDMDLPKIKNVDCLFIYWGGHGVMDNLATRNFLFTEDAAAGIPYCVCVQEMMSALKGPRFGHITEQIAIIDSCANPFSDTRETAQLSPAAFAQPGGIVFSTKQFVMLSAAPGQVAINLSEQSTGLFSQSLYSILKKHEEQTWPDFRSAFYATLASVGDSELGAQQPLLVIHWPGEGPLRVGDSPGTPPMVASLLPLVEEAGGAPNLLYHLYLQAHPEPARALGKMPIEILLQDLNDFRPRVSNYPSPLIEFAERLGRSLNKVVLSDWVKDKTAQNRTARTALYTAMAAEMAADRPKATLFIEIDDARTYLRWSLHAPEPKDRGAVRGEAHIEVGPEDDKPFKERVAALVASALAEVEAKVGHKYQPVVSFIVPDALLLSGIESMRVILDEDGLQAISRRLNKCYPVTLHWNRRVMANMKEGGGRAINAWKLNLPLLTARIQAGGGAEVVWVEPAVPGDESDPSSCAAKQLLSPHGTGICVGLGHVAKPDTGKPAEQVVDCLRQGVPCFFWLAHPPEDDLGARKAICNIFLQQKASETPIGIAKHLKDATRHSPLYSICMVWDEPGYLPLVQMTQSP